MLKISGNDTFKNYDISQIDEDVDNRLLNGIEFIMRVLLIFFFNACIVLHLKLVLIKIKHILLFNYSLLQ